MDKISKSMAQPIILFDGICNLCNGFVQFVIKRDKKALFRFGSLQSKAAQKILADKNLPLKNFKTIVLVEGVGVFVQSEAVLKILGRLKGWKWVSVFKYVPRFIRDFVYGLISRYRYHIFGKKESCMIPTPELKGRFIEG